jgi:hypothetical protein
MTSHQLIRMKEATPALQMTCETYGYLYRASILQGKRPTQPTHARPLELVAEVKNTAHGCEVQAVVIYFDVLPKFGSMGVASMQIALHEVLVKQLEELCSRGFGFLGASACHDEDGTLTRVGNTSVAGIRAVEDGLGVDGGRESKVVQQSATYAKADAAVVGQSEVAERMKSKRTCWHP